jgi:hypothetical protein
MGGFFQSIFETKSVARLKSSCSPMIKSVSKASTMVAAIQTTV